MFNPSHTTGHDMGGDYIVVGSYKFYPMITWNDAVSPFGCFSRSIAYLTMNLGKLVHAETSEKFFKKQYIPGVPLSEEQQDFIDRMGLYVSGNMEIQNVLVATYKPEFCRVLFTAAMNNSWKSFILAYGSAGIVLWGDALTMAGYWTKYLAWYLKNRGEGALSSTHAVANPNYPSMVKMCRIWAWTPNKYAPLAIPTGETFGVTPRKSSDVAASIKKIWAVEPTRIKYDTVLELFEEDRELLTKTAV